MIYTHVLNRGGFDVRRPLDGRPLHPDLPSPERYPALDSGSIPEARPDAKTTPQATIGTQEMNSMRARGDKLTSARD